MHLHIYLYAQWQITQVIMILLSASHQKVEFIFYIS